MSSSHPMIPVVVDDTVEFTLIELCRAVRAPEAQVRVWVVEGVLTPRGVSPQEWRIEPATQAQAERAAHHRVSPLLRAVDWSKIRNACADPSAPP